MKITSIIGDPNLPQQKNAADTLYPQELGMRGEPAHHEESITIEMDGAFVNLPTVVNGKKVSDKEAARLFRERKLKPLGDVTYKTLQEAVDAAKKRSDESEPH